MTNTEAGRLLTWHPSAAASFSCTLAKGSMAPPAKGKALTSNAELGMRSTLGDWPTHRSAKLAPALSLVPETELRAVHAEHSLSPPRWSQHPTESGSGALPAVSSSKHLHDRHGVHRIDPRSPGHHRYMIAPGVGAVLSPLPRSAGRKRRDKPTFHPPLAHTPTPALEDDPTELLFADIWPSPTVRSMLQNHHTSRTAIGHVSRVRAAGRRSISCEPVPTPQPDALSTGRLSGRFYTPPDEERLCVGRMRGRLAYRSPVSLEPLRHRQRQRQRQTETARPEQAQSMSPVMDSPGSPTRRRSGKMSARRHWGGGREILDRTRSHMQAELSVSSTALPAEAGQGSGPDERIRQQQESTISAVDRWLKTGVLPAQWEDTGQWEGAGEDELPTLRIPYANE